MMKQIEPDFWAFRGRYSRTACRSSRTDRSPVPTGSEEAEERESSASK